MNILGRNCSLWLIRESPLPGRSSPIAAEQLICERSCESYNVVVADVLLIYYYLLVVFGERVAGELGLAPRILAICKDGTLFIHYKVRQRRRRELT